MLGYNTGLLNCDGMIIKSIPMQLLSVYWAWAALQTFSPYRQFLCMKGQADRLMNDLVLFTYSGPALVYFSRSEDVKDFTIRHMHFHCFSRPGFRIENRSHYNNGVYAA